jgi:general secretion pathway protein I
VEAGFAARPEAGSAAGPEAGSAAGPEAGFTLVEMLVAMMLLSLVGLTLARFQTFQLSGAASLATTAAARLEADNLAVEALAAPALPVATDGISSNAGREWHYAIGTGPSPDPAALPDLMRVDIAVSLQPGGPVIARRTVLRSRAGQAFAQ